MADSASLYGRFSFMGLSPVNSEDWDDEVKDKPIRLYRAFVFILTLYYTLKFEWQLKSDLVEKAPSHPNKILCKVTEALNLFGTQSYKAVICDPLPSEKHEIIIDIVAGEYPSFVGSFARPFLEKGGNIIGDCVTSFNHIDNGIEDPEYAYATYYLKGRRPKECHPISRFSIYVSERDAENLVLLTQNLDSLMSAVLGFNPKRPAELFIEISFVNNPRDQYDLATFNRQFVCSYRVIPAYRNIGFNDEDIIH